MSRFYISKDSVKGNIISITGSEAHHILDVMRLKKSDKVAVFDGTGIEYAGIIKETKPKSLRIEILETRAADVNEKVKITLMQAIPKKEKMDYIVEKATELGVASIAPLVTERTIVRWDDEKKNASVERWRRIAREASKQCGRADIPEVGHIKDFDEIVKAKSAYGLSLIAALSDDAAPIKEVLAGFKGKDIAIVIGPEGDFTPREIDLAEACGFKTVNLGSRVLKSDTAGLVTLAILNYEYSN